MTFCHQEHCAWTLFIIFLFLYNLLLSRWKPLPTELPFFFLWCRQPSCSFIVWLYISEANLQSRFRSGTADFCFRLLMAVDGFWHQPLLHQRGVFAQRPAARWMLLFLQISERDRRTWKSRQFGRPMRLTRTAILCWKKQWDHLSTRFWGIVWTWALYQAHVYEPKCTELLPWDVCAYEQLNSSG